MQLKDPRRGGVLTQASVLTVTSNPTRTSPVKRGKWVLEQLLGIEPPPPPPEVEELKEEGAQLVGTLRQRLEQHRSQASCAICHRQMDPLGFDRRTYGIGARRGGEPRYRRDRRNARRDDVSRPGRREGNSAAERRRLPSLLCGKAADLCPGARRRVL